MKPLCTPMLAGCFLAGSAHASCGAAFCSVSNDWLTVSQEVTQGWRAWGQVEYLSQNQLRDGSKKIAPAEVNADHVEIKTLNRNALLGLEYGFASGWSASLVLPYSNRDHLHIHHDVTPVPEAWEFDHIGDVRLKLRYQPAVRHLGGVSWNLQAGLKLPTGRTNVRNADGNQAERSVQPGTGTTDLLLGAGLTYLPPSLPGSLFSNLTAQLPLNEDGGYQPGWRTSLQAGWLIPVSGKLDLVLQGSLLHVGPDRGVNAEPADSGRTELAVAPGLAYAWSRTVLLYGQLELPVYQKVTGIQLTHDYAISIGLSRIFN